MIEKLLNRMGYIKKSKVSNQLNFAPNIAKRLDEHREYFEFLSSQDFLKSTKEWEFLVGHWTTQDDYLMRLYFMAHGSFPPVSRRARLYGHVRARPKEFGKFYFLSMPRH